MSDMYLLKIKEELSYCFDVEMALKNPTPQLIMDILNATERIYKKAVKGELK